ncbi:MAG: hypothetical protein RR472_08800, partial [Anaerovoracaceae bacterium]
MMSRNKIVLLLAAGMILYLLLPSTGTGGLIRAYMLALLPYLLILIIVWLLITINLLRKAMSRLAKDLTDRNTLAVAKLLRMSFDVKRFMGETNLINLYKQANFSRNVSLSSKQALYDALQRKRINVPLPSTGKSGGTPAV